LTVALRNRSTSLGLNTSGNRQEDGRNVVRAEEEPDATLPTEPSGLAKAWLVTWRPLLIIEK
jgi:hypothetical protein